mmetsp:Transcript_58577/g.127385  ORF Transcript_58577/g.127385 Transcript_58577/m.127385 type:complete len:185 (+) Transcript_58577:1-555(+)
MGALLLLLWSVCLVGPSLSRHCDQVYPFQRVCERPVIDPETGEAFGCRPDDLVPVNCSVLLEVPCQGPREFQIEKPCRYTWRDQLPTLTRRRTGYKLSTTLALSIFFGNLGLDRFYLGYPTVGLIKLATCGFFVLGNVLDITLIATQWLRPADGSHYIVGPNGPRERLAVRTDETTLWITAEEN